MFFECRACGATYDDVVSWTTCPHGPLGGSNSYCRKHDLDPCPFCDPTVTNPLVKPESDKPQIRISTPYADAFVCFQKALDECVASARTFYAIHPDNITEADREALRLANLEVLKLYNKILTKLRAAGVEP